MAAILSVTYDDLKLITPSDSALVTGNVAAGFGASTGGTMTVTTVGGTQVQITVVSGIIYPIAITKIWSTGTAATGTFAVYANPYKARPSV